MKKIQLSDHFSYGKLIRFVIPSIIMMIFTSIYGVVDGLFISNYVGKTPFAAVNIIYPFIMILGAIGFMLGTGGSALVAKTLGEGKPKSANEYFSMLIYTAIVSGIIIGIIGIIFTAPISKLLGADVEMQKYCVIYARIIFAALPAFMLQNMFQSFLITAEKPTLGLVMTVIAGVTNIIMDALLVAVFEFGIVGAAVATALSQCVGGIVPLLYFARKNSSLLHLTKTRFMGNVLWKSCSNGLSELVSNISMSLVSVLFNFQLMRFAGEDGVAAYGVIMYVNFIFIGIFFGYSLGTAPIFGYNYGAANQAELKNVFKKSMIIITTAGVILTGVALVLARPLSLIFVSYDQELLSMTIRGFMIYALSFLICGFGIFGSSFFTALNDGVVSAVISFLRTVVFQVVAVVFLPMVFGLDGIWYSIVVAEVAATIVVFCFLFAKRKKYQYM